MLLDDDGRSSAALAQLIPRSPGALLKAVLWVTGKWPKPKIIEFTSYAEDGRVCSTSNPGEVNQFSPAPNVSRRSLPLGASVEEVWRAHPAQLLAEEIDRLLAPHGKHGEMVRPHLLRALAER